MEGRREVGAWGVGEKDPPMNPALTCTLQVLVVVGGGGHTHRYSRIRVFKAYFLPLWACSGALCNPGHVFHIGECSRNESGVVLGSFQPPLLFQVQAQSGSLILLRL